ncbi:MULTISPECIES: Hsp20/alpha crystallin family protein [Maridesulfovibrio]|uniref:Heat shock protein Hsp20 n=1 Tax=Maridesulfovibrio salexigens (strain ATCC 14822 / DSM 2638 / NCIMB 8403 / VKM B-1763) TaxID=526222 RepID=C6BUZ2_MARSD|nr:Hsp20/alpha crystallin family protein [Maridesulfovibrio salexigens]ACS78129.1 heat shock protein Hsp20 [Maridesulfovibrio salexigens DSM 2638]|eukprot:gnl/Carplike_NY0171/1414_a1926_585.p3 GENE.gnl/Carplike_NY0171/1414_a1926_585~~gnl/Carplike_NY0171/1414_a1926_585.p3  ORF type:complete len:117 (+),score=15.42 gnl/Carplike_NY0171/1414_a1926_585:434-784(+)
MTTEKNMEKFSPATDIVESEQGFYMYVDLPGVSKEALEIDLDENTLIVSGKAATALGEDEKFIDQEFCEGEYTRRFTIADVVDRENIKANLKNGVLELFLPKMPEVQPRKIQITNE